MIISTDCASSGILRSNKGNIKWTKSIQDGNAFQAALDIVKETVKTENRLCIKVNKAALRRALEDPLQAPWHERFTASRIACLLKHTEVSII